MPGEAGKPGYLKKEGGLAQTEVKTIRLARGRATEINGVRINGVRVIDLMTPFRINRVRVIDLMSPLLINEVRVIDLMPPLKPASMGSESLI